MSVTLNALHRTLSNAKAYFSLGNGPENRITSSHYLTYNFLRLKAFGGIPNKTHQPGLFCFTHMKMQQKISYLLRFTQRRSERALIIG